MKRELPTTYDTKSTETAIALLKKARALKLALLFGVVSLCSCAGSTGWRFEIGVSPVKQLSNTAGLTQESEAPAITTRRQ